jgi:hypothetical protein
MKYATLLTLLLLTACDAPKRHWAYDQCLRREIMKECLSAAPPGPLSTHYNDWSEVINACSKAAEDQSLRRIETVKPECQD